METTTFTPKDNGTRKHLAEIIGTVLGGLKPTYLGAPSMAYQVGPVTLERDWTVTWPADLPARDTQLIEKAATQAGYGAARKREPQDTAAAGGLRLAFPTTGLEERTRGNLEAMLASKGALIGKALGLKALPVEFTEDQAVFPWFDQEPAREVAEAAGQLLAAMVQAASDAKRVSPKPPAGANEKYTMRCFLLRLGFIGEEYKAARKTLMRNLEGSAAWANPPAPTAKEEEDEDEVPVPKDPRGTRVRLRCLTDPHTRLRAGSEGTIMFIDSLGTVHVAWDCGSTLGLIPGEDSWETLPNASLAANKS